MSKFATAINCMDGRMQIPVIVYLKNKYEVDYVDMITSPGTNKVLAESKNKAVLESIKRYVEISVNLMAQDSLLSADITIVQQTLQMKKTR